MFYKTGIIFPKLPSSIIVVLLSTHRVDGKHQWC